MKKEQIGRSMIEMVGVLAIIAVLAVGVYGIYTLALRKMNVGQTVDLVQNLINDIRMAHSVRTEYYGVGDNENENVVNRFITKNIIDRGLCASKVVCGGSACTCPSSSATGSVDSDGNGNLKHPLKGALNININKAERTLRITLDNLVNSSCVGLVTSDWGTGGGESNVVRRIEVNGNVINQETLNGASVTTFPVNVGVANAACSNGRNNTVKFVVKPLRNN